MFMPAHRALRALAVIAALLASALFGSGAALAATVMAFVEEAEPTEAVVNVEDFLIEAFPHETADVSFSDSWGAARSGGRRHKGTDIKSPRGTPLVAVAAGTISHMDWSRLSGWNIRIEHAEGWVSSYLHLNNDTAGTDDGEGGSERAFAEGLEVGSTVEAGTMIGFVGDSGNAEDTIAHTHFELKNGDQKVNPFPYLEVAWERKLLLYEAEGDAA